MRKKPKSYQPHEALNHDDHAAPVTRRDFLGRGLMAGAGILAGPSVFGLFSNPLQAQVMLSDDVEALRQECGIAVQGAGKIPFIGIDLAGGANIAGSNVLTGKTGGQLDFLSTQGYSKLGLPGDMIPPVVNPQTGTNDFIDTRLGLAFHSDSAFLRGITDRVSATTMQNIHGAVIPARSDNDTGNNPHNPMYGIYRAGSDGELLSLIGTRNSDSGGNSMAPEMLIDPAARPTKVDRASDVTGLVDTGKLIGLLDQSDAVAVMESIQRISDMKLNTVNTGVTQDELIKDLVRCGYVKAADLSARFGDPSTLNPELDSEILGATGIFSQDEYDSNSNFRKTAAVMKLVVNGFAGAGTIELGGFDYHTGDRATGERRDLMAGRCMGACLEYAARVGVPLMLYVFSDGSVASNGRIDESPDGGGKGEWTGDNSSTAASFFLVFNPNGRPTPFSGDSLGPERHIQIGHFRADGSVETTATPAASNVNLLAQTVILNYLALHDQQGEFGTLFPQHGLGNATLQDSLTAFDPIVNGTIG
ncbi:MAG: general secretion pathway protein GspF [Gammaproteobacteria bacterium]|nr:general secretion pathway protein GspF [Gammaproteobacteria bacterium]NNF66627.1 general secretion pathway protein GspF [Gammaproteobacteria bacterium]